MILADKIIENRKKNGWSQEDLAAKLGVSRQSVSKWEGAQAIPDMKKILQMSELFGVSTDYLLKDNIEENTLTGTESVEYAFEDEAPQRVSVEEANNFLSYNEKAASVISTGVMLFILSPVLLIVLPGLAEIGKIPLSEYNATMLGLMVLLVMVACGVALLIMTGIKGKAFQYLESKSIDTDYGVSGMVRERCDRYEGTHTRLLVIGIVLCIVSSIPLFATIMSSYSTAKLEGLLVPVGVALLIIMIACGVKLIILTSIRQGGFDKLLEEGDYTRLNKKTGAWEGVYWAIAVAIYLTWSFISMQWRTTWIVWPIAGVIFAAYKEILKMIIKSKN